MADDKREYFLFTLTEDGDIYINNYTREELFAEIDEELEAGDFELDEFIRNVMKFENLGNLKGKLLIKGKIVIPNPVKVVTKFEVE